MWLDNKSLIINKGKQKQQVNLSANFVFTKKLTMNNLLQKSSLLKKNILFFMALHSLNSFAQPNDLVEQWYTFISKKAGILDIAQMVERSKSGMHATFDYNLKKKLNSYVFYSDVKERSVPVDFGTLETTDNNTIQFTSRMNDTNYFHPGRYIINNKIYYCVLDRNNIYSYDTDYDFKENRKLFPDITEKQMKSDSIFISITINTNYTVPVSFYFISYDEAGVETEKHIQTVELKAKKTKLFTFDCRAYKDKYNLAVVGRINNQTIFKTGPGNPIGDRNRIISASTGFPQSFTISTYLLPNKTLNQKCELINNQLIFKNVKWASNKDLIFTERK